MTVSSLGVWSLSITFASTLVLPGCVDEEDEPATDEAALTYTLSCQSPGTGFGAFVLPPGPGRPLPFVPLTSLQAVANPVVPPDPRRGTPTVREDLVDYVQLFVTPHVLAPAGVPLFDGLARSIPALVEPQVAMWGPDVIIEGYVHRVD